VLRSAEVPLLLIRTPAELKRAAQSIENKVEIHG
jgi:hypothetical protein